MCYRWAVFPTLRISAGWPSKFMFITVNESQYILQHVCLLYSEENFRFLFPGGWIFCLEAAYVSNSIFPDILLTRPPLCSSGQSSLPQIQRPRVRFPELPYFLEVVGLKRDPLSLVRITEELLEWKSSCSGSRKSTLTALRIRCPDHATPSTSKSWH
jgi:hypothetical protein